MAVSGKKTKACYGTTTKYPRTSSPNRLWTDRTLLSSSITVDSGRVLPGLSPLSQPTLDAYCVTSHLCHSRLWTRAAQPLTSVTADSGRVLRDLSPLSQPTLDAYCVTSHLCHSRLWTRAAQPLTSVTADSGRVLRDLSPLSQPRRISRQRAAGPSQCSRREASWTTSRRAGGPAGGSAASSSRPKSSTVRHCGSADVAVPVTCSAQPGS